MTAMELIASRLAAPKAFKVVTTFEDGAKREHMTETRSQAENYAVGERRKIGCKLVSRACGGYICVKSVDVAAI